MHHTYDYRDRGPRYPWKLAPLAIAGACSILGACTGSRETHDHVASTQVVADAGSVALGRPVVVASEARRLGSARSEIKRSGVKYVDLLDTTATLDALAATHQSYFIAPTVGNQFGGDPNYTGIVTFSSARDGRTGPTSADVRSCLETLGYTFASACPSGGCPGEDEKQWTVFHDLLDKNETRCAEQGGHCTELGLWVANNDDEQVRWGASTITDGSRTGAAVNWTWAANELSCIAETHPHFSTMMVDDFYWLDDGAFAAVGAETLEIRGLCSPERLFLAEGISQTGVPEHLVRYRTASGNSLCYGNSIASAISSELHKKSQNTGLVPWIYPRQAGELIADAWVIGSATTGKFVDGASATRSRAFSTKFRISSAMREKLYLSAIYQVQADDVTTAAVLVLEWLVNDVVVRTESLTAGTAEEIADRPRVAFFELPKSALSSRGSNRVGVRVRAPSGYSGKGRALAHVWGQRLYLSKATTPTFLTATSPDKGTGTLGLPTPEALDSSDCVSLEECTWGAESSSTSGGTDLMARKSSEWSNSFTHCFSNPSLGCFSAVMSHLNQIRYDDTVMTKTQYAHVIDAQKRAMNGVTFITSHQGRPDTDAYDAAWDSARLTTFMNVADRFTPHHVVYEFPLAIAGWNQEAPTSSFGIFDERSDDSTSLRVIFPNQQVIYKGFTQTFSRALTSGTFSLRSTSTISGALETDESKQQAWDAFEARIALVSGTTETALIDGFSLEPLDSRCAFSDESSIVGSTVYRTTTCKLGALPSDARVVVTLRTIAAKYPANLTLGYDFFSSECAATSCSSPWANSWDYDVTADAEHRQTYDEVSSAYSCLATTSTSCF